MDKKADELVPSFDLIMNWSDDQCRDYLVRMRWPDGIKCPKCGAPKPYTITRRTRTKNKVRSFYKCRKCRRQFTHTVGTIFEDSKIPLQKWFAAIYLMCSSKKGISAHQLHRMLKITYKSAWFMCHRIREATKDKNPKKLEGIVEADETYMGGRRRRGHNLYHERLKDEIDMGIRTKPPYQEKTAVFGMVERQGEVRSMVVPRATGRYLKPIMTTMINLRDSELMTDGSPIYKGMSDYLPHGVINKELAYIAGDIHTQNIEGYWSILKTGVYGVFHHVGDGYLPMYLGEFDFRFNSRRLSDGERFQRLLSQVSGKRVLWFCETEQPANPHA